MTIKPNRAEPKAEALALEEAAHAPKILDCLSPEESRLMLHELRVHQVELEAQNEELRKTQAELVRARESYFDLYDLAPVGYCTVDKESLIREANLTASTMFGVPRSSLVRQPLTRFLLKEDQDAYYLLLKKLMQSGKPQSCDLRILEYDGTAFRVHLAATITSEAESPVVIRIAMMRCNRG